MQKARNRGAMPKPSACRTPTAVSGAIPEKPAISIADAAPVGRQVPRKPTRLQKAMRYLRRNALYIAGLVMILAAAIMLMSLIGAIDRKLNENAIRDYGRERLYAEYTVKAGDTLWSISADMSSVMPEYASVKAYLNDIKAVNRTGDSIKAGQKLMLPYYEKDGSQSKIFAAYGIPGIS